MVEAYAIEPAGRRGEGGPRPAALSISRDLGPGEDPAGNWENAVTDQVCDHIAQQIVTGRRPPGEPLKRVRAASARDRVAAAEALVLATLPRRADESLLASALGIERRALREAFLDVRGRTLYRALLVLRLLAARKTLERHPDLPPAAVARGCGFVSYGRLKKDLRAVLGFDIKQAPDATRGQGRGPEHA